MAATNNHHDELPRLASTSPTECCACNCEKPFNDNERVPRVLSECGHTVCDPCLRQLAKPTSDGKLEATCPSCPTTTKIGGVDAFPTNHILLDHIRSVQPKPSTKPKCGACKQQDAEFGCADCQGSLCSDCWPKIHTFGVLLSHVKGSLSDAEQPLQCSRHQEKLNYLCVDASCPAKDELICHLCKDTPSHKGHQTEVLDQGLIDRVFDGKRHELNADIDRMHDSIAFAARVLAHVNSTQQATTTNRDTAIHHIEEHFEQLIEQLRTRKAELIGQVNALVGRKSEKLEAQRREVTGYLEQSYSAVHAGVDGMKVTNQRQFLSRYRSLHDRLAQLSNTKLFGKAVVSPLVNVSLGDELGDSIRKHGAVADDGDVVQARTLPSFRVELVPHSPMPCDAVKGVVPEAVRRMHGDGVQLHCVRWDAGKCHRDLEISSGGATVKQVGATGCGWRNCFGIASSAMKYGVHYFSVRVVNPGGGWIFVGFSEGKHSTTENSFPGNGAHNGDLGAALCLSDGRVYFPFNGSCKNAPCAQGGARVCSIGVLLDLNAHKASFFIDGANKLDNGPFLDYPVPAGKTWFPWIGLQDKDGTITSESLK